MIYSINELNSLMGDGHENLKWRRGLITDIVTKDESNKLLSRSQRITNFGSGSTVFMQARMIMSTQARGLERALSHISTKVSTSTKLAARKVRGDRFRDMLVHGVGTYEYS